jgi:hypothetical protein
MKKKKKAAVIKKTPKRPAIEKEIEAEQFIDEVTDFEDHDDPEYPFDEKVKYPAMQTGENNSIKK